MCCERLENARKHILPQSCSTSMCCETLREYPKTHFIPILFDIYALRETQRISENTFYPNLVRHLCAARDSANARKHILPQSCSTSMCCESFRECPKTHFTPILFDIYVRRETQRIPENTFYPNLVRHLCAARDLENARKHMFTPILFDIYVLRET